MLDDQGFVVDTGSWTKDLAKKIAKEQFSIELTEAHWACIEIVREYYEKWESIPMIKTIRERAKISIDEFDRLFKHDQGSSRGVLCKISGLPKLLCISAGC